MFQRNNPRYFGYNYHIQRKQEPLICKILENDEIVAPKIIIWAIKICLAAPLLLIALIILLIVASACLVLIAIIVVVTYFTEERPHLQTATTI